MAGADRDLADRQVIVPGTDVPRRVGRQMSQVQPASCAVEMVCEAMDASGVWYGTCVASAVSQKRTSRHSLKPTPSVLPISNAWKPVQSMKRSPRISPACLVSTPSMSPESD
jgi:hypothetical protein